MDEATDIRFGDLERRMDSAEKKQEGHSCPQEGCRFMESQGKKQGGIANWLTFAGLLVLAIFEILGQFS